ncbi:MAG TPA: hypothetical protein EYP98_14330 [Planctomycetes bacterium]|nr:hypothetical protein [Planctomycetota bacterium]
MLLQGRELSLSLNLRRVGSNATSQGLDLPLDILPFLRQILDRHTTGNALLNPYGHTSCGST